MLLNGLELINHDSLRLYQFGPEFQVITEEMIPPLTLYFLENAAKPPYDVIMDLRHTTFFGSSFLEVLLKLWSRIKAQNGRLALAGLTPHCVDVLRVSHLDRLWTITDKLADAVALLKPPT